MSKKLSAGIGCPQCGHETLTELYRTIWVEYPENRALILNDEINAVTCERCGLKQRCEFPFFATNHPRRFALWYEPYPDAQIDLDAALYRKQFGRNHFLAIAPRISDWEAFKRTLIEMETAAGEPAEGNDRTASPARQGSRQSARTIMRRSHQALSAPRLPDGAPEMPSARQAKSVESSPMPHSESTLALSFRPNRLQRAVLSVTAGIIIFIQLARIANLGLDENPAWFLVLLVAAGLLVVGLQPDTQPGINVRAEPERGLYGPAHKAPSAEVVDRVGAQMDAAPQAIDETERIGARILTYVIGNDLDRRGNFAVWVTDPNKVSTQAAHALISVAVAESQAAVDPLLWNTYRATLAVRIEQQFDRRLARLLGKAEVPGPDRSELELAIQELGLWEETARKALSAVSNKKFVGLATYAAILLGCRKGSFDEVAFAAHLSACYEDATRNVLPVLLMLNGWDNVPRRRYMPICPSRRLISARQ